MIKYLIATYFSGIPEIRIRSFDSHIRRLRNINTPLPANLFKRYRLYILEKEAKIYFKIINIKDKLITHRTLETHESWLINSRKNFFCVNLTKGRAYLPIDPEIIERIKEILRERRLETNFIDSNQFYYIDDLLDKIETENRIFTNEEREEIANLRIRLGVSIYEDKVIQILKDFCEGLCELLGNEKRSDEI